MPIISTVLGAENSLRHNMKKEWKRRILQILYNYYVWNKT